MSKFGMNGEFWPVPMHVFYPDGLGAPSMSKRSTNPIFSGSILSRKLPSLT